MSAQQKHAWFNLVVAGMAILAYFALWPLIGPWRAMGAFGLLGFAGFNAFFYLKGKKSGRVVSDERDQAICAKAHTVAWSVIWVSIIAAFLVALRFFGEDGSIPIRGLGMFLWWSFCAFLVVQSLATLILYARR